ncbi:hypothetical protein ACPOL_0702 [Acidisarcina polymorpha]|uniref:Uncharacterized protein n=1 Tax=Acidisarcina polymorpha TaxID=2211140 RepID=A0A2Z5FUM8_9BACT|nr:hypothetical protein ACPOL_0702 [Acidisarcina polymorpha]
MNPIIMVRFIEFSTEYRHQLFELVNSVLLLYGFKKRKQ